MKKILQIMVLSVVLAAMSSYGTPQLGWTENWASGLGTGGAWNGTGTPTTTLDNGGSSLRLTMPDQPTTTGSIWADSNSSGGKFTGSFVGLGAGDNLTVEFKIKTENDYNDQSGNLGMYFIGGAGGITHTWYYTPVASLNQPVQGTGYKTIDLVIGNASYWNNYFGATFLTDFAAVTEFGFTFVGGPTENMTHPIYLTDLKLLDGVPVPEPETVWMMVMVLASLALTFRGRLADLGNQVKARLVA